MKRPKQPLVRGWFQLFSFFINYRGFWAATLLTSSGCVSVAYFRDPTEYEPLVTVLMGIGFIIGLMSLYMFWRTTSVIRIRVSYSVPTKKRQPPSLKGLVQFADWWGLDLRKRIKALAGDYDAEVRRLCRADRYPTARWNKVLAWIFAFWYIGRGPLDWIRALLLLAVKGK